MEQNQQKDIEALDFENQVININGPSITHPNQPHQKDQSYLQIPNQSLDPTKLFESKKEEIANNFLDSVGAKMQKTWVDKILCCFGFLRQYFTITTMEVKQRIISSLIPFNASFYEISSGSPDLYGPFWIYTTLIFVTAACGSLSKYFQGNSTTNFFQDFVPIASTVIYGIGFGLPALIYILMKVFGSDTSYPCALCIYGYSLSVFIPVIIVCSSGVTVVQWIFLIYGCISSTSFLLINYWKELSSQITRRKYWIIGITVLFQLGLFLMLKLYFFKPVQKAITPSS